VRIDRWHNGLSDEPEIRKRRDEYPISLCQGSIAVQADVLPIWNSICLESFAMRGLLG
jgi:hypothetical protein